MSAATSEFRVTWKRVTWSSTTKAKSRIFGREADARGFVTKLCSDNRPDLGLLELVKLDRRPVGAWVEVES